MYPNYKKFWCPFIVLGLYNTKHLKKEKKKKPQAKKDALCCITSSPSFICPFPNIIVLRSYVLYIHHHIPNLCVTQI